MSHLEIDPRAVTYIYDLSPDPDCEFIEAERRHLLDLAQELERLAVEIRHVTHHEFWRPEGFQLEWCSRQEALMNQMAVLANPKKRAAIHTMAVAIHFGSRRFGSDPLIPIEDALARAKRILLNKGDDPNLLKLNPFLRQRVADRRELQAKNKEAWV